MTRMFVIGEDSLTCALGERLVRDVKGWDLAQPAIDKKGISHLRKAFPGYMNLVRVCPVLCIADADGNCAVDLVKAWSPKCLPKDFLLRFAVAESESWIMADRDAFAEFLSVACNKIPRAPDEELDAKRKVVNLARGSRDRNIRNEMVSNMDISKPGSGYNYWLKRFINEGWRPERAALNSPSLSRAITRLNKI